MKLTVWFWLIHVLFEDCTWIWILTETFNFCHTFAEVASLQQVDIEIEQRGDIEIETEEQIDRFIEILAPHVWYSGGLRCFLWMRWPSWETSVRNIELHLWFPSLNLYNYLVKHFTTQADVIHFRFLISALCFKWV